MDDREYVFVVQRGILFPDFTPQGMISLHVSGEHGARWLETAERQGFFGPRDEVETDPRLKQIIPYCVVTAGDRVFLLQRLKGGGEKRLHHLLSVGVGGHINPVDGERSSSERLLRAARRELEEELILPDLLSLKPMGFVNDESNPVGSVHFGVVFEARIEEGSDVRIRESDQLQGALIPRSELFRRLDEQPDSFETWSQLVIEGLRATSQ